MGAGVGKKNVGERKRKRKKEDIRWEDMGESEPSILDPMARKFK